MIYAKDAHEISEKNNYEKEMINFSVKKVLILFDEKINKVANYGGFGCFIKKSDIKSAIGNVLINTEKVMDAVRDEMRSYGYNVSIPQSYTSIHVDW